MARNSSKLFTAYCVAAFTVAVAMGGLFLMRGQRAPLDQVLILGILFAVAENRSVELSNRSSLSASLMIAMTAIVLFNASAPGLGPLAVGICGGIYLPQVRAGEWRKVLFNSANFGLSSLAASALFTLLVASDSSPAFLLAASVPVALIYSLANSALLVPAMTMLTGRPFLDVGQEMWVSDIQILPFGFFGVLLGELYLHLGGWMVPLFVAPIFIARQAFASHLQLKAAQEATLTTLMRALEAKDQYTAGHVERVARFCEAIGHQLGFRPARLERLRYAALMHDIGKLIVPNQILNKPGRLTASEYERMRHHEVVSVELLRRIDFLAPVVSSIEAEHGGEFQDAAVPLEARIIAVADAFDAMTSTRAYRQALTQDVAFAELRDKSGTQFDAQCVEALIESIQLRGEHFGAGFEDAVASFSSPPPAVGTGSAGLGDLALEPQRVER